MVSANSAVYRQGAEDTALRGANVKDGHYWLLVIQPGDLTSWLVLFAVKAKANPDASRLIQTDGPSSGSIQHERYAPLL